MGDESCWGGGYTHELCCVLKEVDCWDGVFTAARCCEVEEEEVKTALQEEVRTALQPLEVRTALQPLLLLVEWAQYFLESTFHSGLFVCLPAVCLGVVSLLSERIKSTRNYRSEAVVPAACALRVIAVASVLAFHYMDDLLPPSTEPQPLRSYMLSLRVVLHDIFFVLSAFFTAGEITEDSPQTWTSKMLSASVRESSALLRRVVRTIPPVVVVTMVVMDGMSIWSVFTSGWLLDVDFVCYVVLCVLRGTARVFGEKPRMAIVVALFALCMAEQTPAWPLQSESVSSFPHQSVTRVQLPICLTTIMFVHLFRKFSCHTVGEEVSGMGAPWIVAIIGIVITSFLEWFWVLGSFAAMPRWSYPIVTKLPLILGCVVLLERSRQMVQQHSEPWKSTILSHLDSYSWSSMAAHTHFRASVIKYLWHPTPLQLELVNVFYLLPSHVFWSFATGSVLFWMQEPYSRAMLFLLETAGNNACDNNRRWVRFLLSTALVFLAASCTAVVTKHIPMDWIQDSLKLVVGYGGVE